MSQVVKFPDMRPAAPRGPIRLPPPSGYVQRVPLFPTTDGSVKSRRFERKRLLLWFGIAVAFHAALLLGLWLMPALRIKWEPSADAWVPVISVSNAQPLPPAADPVNARIPVEVPGAPHQVPRRAQSRPELGRSEKPP